MRQFTSLAKLRLMINVFTTTHLMYQILRRLKQNSSLERETRRGLPAGRASCLTSEPCSTHKRAFFFFLACSECWEAYKGSKPAAEKCGECGEPLSFVEGKFSGSYVTLGDGIKVHGAFVMSSFLPFFPTGIRGVLTPGTELLSCRVRRSPITTVFAVFS